VSVGLTDAATTDYKAVYVTVQQVAVHMEGQAEGQWRVISTPNKTYNLLTLVNGVREELGLATLPAGHYTQMRLLLTSIPDTSLNILSHTHPYGNYFIDKDDNVQELKVPSGLQTGIKIVKGFDISTNETTQLLLDFDATRSIVQAGTSGKWLLQPTIKVLNVVEYSIIQGNAGQAGVLVSAQTYTAPDSINVVASTVSADDGSYKLFVRPLTYTIVAYKEGYAPYSTEIEATTAGTVYTVSSFTLTPASSSGTVTGTVMIASADQEQYATISIRKTVGSGQIEITSRNVANGGTFTITLPAADYSIVISSSGRQSVTQDFTISSTPVNLGDITLYLSY
jgi:hypothetical protein